MSAYQGKIKSQNKDAKTELIKVLNSKGYTRAHRLGGSWEGVAEQSYIVQDIHYKDLFDIGRKFNQDSVIYKGKDGIIGMYFLKALKAIVAVNPDLSPAFQTAEGTGLISKVDQNWSFDFGFLWGNEIPWDGQNPISIDQVKAALAKTNP